MVRRKSKAIKTMKTAGNWQFSLYAVKNGKASKSPLWTRMEIDPSLMESPSIMIISAPFGSIKCSQTLEALGHLSLLPEQCEFALCVDGINKLPLEKQALIRSAPGFLGNVKEQLLSTGGYFTKNQHAPSGVLYLGAAPDEIAIQTQLLAAAASTVMCCFMGRGAPAGVDWMGTTKRLYSNRKSLNKLIYATSFGHERFPHIPGNKIDPDSWNYIMEMISHGEFRRGQATASSFREDFTVFPLSCLSGSSEFADTAYNMSQLVVLWRHVMGENELWDDMPDVNPDAVDAAERFIDIGRSVSIDSYIDAFYEGVPIEDLMA